MEEFMKNSDLKYLDPLNDEQKEAVFNVKIENLTPKDVLEKYGDILTEEQKIKLGKTMKKPIIKILQQAGMEVVVPRFIMNGTINKLMIQSQLMNGSPFSPIYQYPNGMISNRKLEGFVDPDKVYLEDGKSFSIEEWNRQLMFFQEKSSPLRNIFIGDKFTLPSPADLSPDFDLPQDQ